MDLKKLKLLGVVAFASVTLSTGAHAACTSLGDGQSGTLDNGAAASWSSVTAGSIDEVCTVSNGEVAENSFGSGGVVASTDVDSTGFLKATSAAMVGSIGSSSLKLYAFQVSGGTTDGTTSVSQVSGGITTVDVQVLEVGLDGANGNEAAAVLHVSGAVSVASSALISAESTLQLGSDSSLSVTSGGLTGGGNIISEGADITFGGGGSVLNHQTNAVSISAAAAGVDIVFAASHSLTGSIDNTSGTAGNSITVTFQDEEDSTIGGETLMTGDIGESADGVALGIASLSVDVGSNEAGTSAGNTKIISGAVYAQAITVTSDTGAAGLLAISGDVATTTTITTSVPINFSGGISAGALTTINVSDGIMVSTSEDVLNEAVIVADGSATTTGFDMGDYENTGTASSSITINLPATFSSGTMHIVTNSAAFTNAQTTMFGIGTSSLVDYTMIVTGNGGTDGDTISISAAAKSADSVAAGLGISTGQANTVLAAISFVSGAQAAALTEAIKTTEGARQAAEQISVQEDLLTATTAAVASVTTSNVNVNTGRLAALRGFNPKVEGYTADNHAMQGVWGEFFGNFASQDERDGVDGFDADTTGLTVGYDRALNSKINLGGSFTLSDTSVEGQGSGQSSLDIKSYLFNVYGDYSREKWFVEGLVGFGFSDNTATRRLTFGGLNQEGSAQFDGQQAMLYVGYGRNYKLGNWNFIPVGSLTYATVANDDYNESGLGDLNLNVDQESISLAIIQTAARFNRRYAVGTDMDFIPEFRVSLGFDAAGDEANATASFQGSSTVFESTGADVAQFLYGAGFGAGLNSGDFTASFNYDLDGRADFWGHNVSLTGKWEF